MKKLTTRIRTIWIILLVILLSAVFFYTAIFIIERPGGIADRRMSQAIGMNDEFLRIPLGKTPEDAVVHFRNFSSSYNVIHQEPAGKGKLVFMTRSGQQENSKNLQVEYVRKTMLGWKWVWGGGFSTTTDSKAAIHYVSFPELKDVSTPFPMACGYILDPLINRITVETMDGDKHEAKLTEVGHEEWLWFVLLPSSADVPYTIKGYDEARKVIASKSIDDPRDSGFFDIE